MAAAWFWLWVQAAAEPGLGASRIIGGQAVSTCSFPGTVMLRMGNSNLCSGSLIHPQVVLYAAHCTEDIATVYFGEDVSRGNLDSFVETQPARKINLPPGACRLYPGHDPSNGSDFAYCRLPQPVTDVPIVPVLMGCEAQILSRPQQVVLVGFGDDGMGRLGVKRTTPTTANQVASNKVQLGSSVHGSRGGDSGGPAFVQLGVDNSAFPGGDGSWRLFGVDSYGLSPGPSPSVYGLAANALPWIEADSGLDLTPCGSAAGVWAPGPGCGQFPTQLSGGTSTWATGCKFAATRAQNSSTCGPAFGAVSPQIELQAPADGDQLVVDDASAQILCRVAFDRADANNQVVATLDGAPLPPLVARGVSPAPVAAYAFGPVAWRAGNHMVACRADDTYGLSTTYSVVLNVAALPATGLAPSGDGGGPAASQDPQAEASSPTQVTAVGSAALPPVLLQSTSAGGCQAATGTGTVGGAAPLVALAVWGRRRRLLRLCLGYRTGPKLGAGACRAGGPRRRLTASGQLPVWGICWGIWLAVASGCGVTLGVGGGSGGQPASTPATGSDADGALVESRSGGAPTSSSDNAATSGSGAQASGMLSVQVVSSQTQSPDANDLSRDVGGIVAATPLPDVQSNIVGTVMGEAVPSGDLLFEFAFDRPRQNNLAMYIFMTDPPASCSRHVSNPNQPLARNTRTLRLELLNINTGEDQPFRGTYQVFNPQTGATPTSGNVALATFVVADGACGNRLVDQNAWATGGQVAISTHVTAGGVYLTGQLLKVSFGSQGDVLDGSFTARGCLTSWAPLDLRNSCR